jgi:hypothetical protein
MASSNVLVAAKSLTVTSASRVVSMAEVSAVVCF